MSEQFQIISDGSCDLPPELTAQKRIRVIPFYVSFDGAVYRKELEEIGIRDFYREMVDKKGVYPRSSLPSVQDYMDAFLPFAKAGIPMLVLCISTRLSGSMQSALSARELILEAYPEAKIRVIDTTLCTVLQGLLVLEAAAMRDRGAGFEETAERIETIKSTGRIFFTVGNLEYLQAGGRIGRVAGIAGSLLGIRPVITMKEGEIFPSGIARSRKKTLERTVDLLKDCLQKWGGPIRKYSLAAGFGYDRDEAEEYRRMVVERTDGQVCLEELPLYQIGATIGVHTGPYPLGLGILERA
ncbi:MAG TPA: DegV family protein [Candidatus Eisenbergiella intestinipullorum]|nr:DegV family protein [Candidatus Eisenbergiella intestinipullorum]